MLGKKIPTLLALLLLVSIGISFWIWQRGSETKTSVGTTPQSVRITNVADNKFSVSWTTQTPTIGKIEYGNVGEKLDKLKGDDRGEEYVGLTHHVTITDLQPGTNYAFRILSGEGLQRFDNNGNVYTVSTGTTIATVPAARSLYGDVANAGEDTLLYLSMPDAQPASLTLNSKGSYSIPLSTIRSSDLKSFVSYDPAATIISLSLDNGMTKSAVTVSTTNITPVPTIAMGQDADFRSLPGQEQPAVSQIAQVEPESEQVPVVPSENQAKPVEIFNVEPLAEPEINAISDGAYTLTNPAIEGEVLSTTKPEFSGTGAANASITVSITGQKEVSDTVRIGSTGSWSWSPAISLALGRQKITISYKDKDGKAQSIVRNFSISSATTTSEPAFVSTPSAGVASTPSAVVSPSPRAGMPATESGVPVTGVMTPMLLTLASGFAIMVLGAFILAL